MKYLTLLITAAIISMCPLLIAQNLEIQGQISLQFEDVPITTILNMIAQQYNLNLVQSGSIEGNISIRLENADLADALHAILISNGYNYYMSGNIIVIKPLEMAAVGETVMKSITLNFISSAAAANAAGALLSPKGKIKVVENPSSGGTLHTEPRPTQILVVDLPQVVKMIAEFIGQIDRQEPQVAIEVRMIEINVDKEKRTGLQWPTQLTARLHGIEAASTGDDNESEAMSAIDLPYGKWQWGKLSVGEMSVMLEFLDKEGNSKLISDPRITTLNNHPAEIKVTTIVPIQTINRFSEGGSVQDIVTFQDEEIGITLFVTPHIIDSNRIILDVNPTVAEITGMSGPSDNQKPITSERSVRTRITVGNMETAVLGGLLKENKMENEQRVFFVGSLPIIGNLFRHKTVQTRTTDLLIMITPTIIGD